MYEPTAFKNVRGVHAFLGRMHLALAVNPLGRLFRPVTYFIACHIKVCVLEKDNAWNYVNAGRFIRFVNRNKWFRNILALGLNNIQSGTKEGEPLTSSGFVTPKVRVDKPWGWEVILATVREGYAEKYLVIAGPLSNQMHDIKVETQTNYGPSPYFLKIDGKPIEIEPGGIFHISEKMWHQPTVRPGGLAIIKETSRSNIGPGSTTRDPKGDPWKGLRKEEDI